MKPLVQASKNKNPQDPKRGWTPLHEAAKNGHLEIAMYLCDQLQDKNPKANKNITPLDWQMSMVKQKL